MVAASWFNNNRLYVTRLIEHIHYMKLKERLSSLNDWFSNDPSAATAILLACTLNGKGNSLTERLH